MVYIFLADGFEDVEAIVPFDLLKRCRANVKTVGVTGARVVSSHGLCVFTDINIRDFDCTLSEKDIIILPGGLEGTENLGSNSKVLEYVKNASESSYLGAICAAPSILGRLGLLNGFKACCYPGFENYLEGATVEDGPVVVDRNIITSKGAGTAFEFAFAIIECLYGKEKADEIKEQVRFRC